MEKALVLPSRPSISKNFKAKPIKLATNHFTISLKGDQKFYLYDIKILNVDKDKEVEVALDARVLRQKIINSILKELKALYGDNFWYSGQILWSMKDQKQLKTIETKVDNRKYAVVLKQVKEVNINPGKLSDNISAMQVRHFLHVLLRKHFKQQKLVEWGRNSKYYDPINFNDLPNFYLQIYTGVKTSCEIYQNANFKMLIDFSSRIVRSDSALYYIRETKNQEDASDLLVGRSVIASYGNYRMWRIDAVDFMSNPTKEFDQDGTKTTLVKYYKKKYGLDIKDYKQPLLVSIDRKTKKTFLLVPELVQMTGLDDEMRKDFKLMSAVAEHTRLDPNQRMRKIKDAADPLSRFLEKDYGVTMARENFVDGYVLNTPKLTLGKGSFVPEKGNYQLKDPIFRPAVFNKWVLVYADPCSREAIDFLQNLKKCSEAFAIKVENPIEVLVKGKKPEDLKAAIRSKVKPDTQIVVAMFPPVAKKPWYKALKDVCYQELGVPCQAILPTSLKKNAMSVCSKLLLQMTVKIKHELWITQVPEGLPPKTMIIGADVFHNTKIGEQKKSCIGFCASLNSNFNQFFSKMTFQSKVGDEMMKGIGNLVKEAVLQYFTFNKKQFLPEYIIFYRDGVADNQIQQVIEFETIAILEQLKTIDPDYNFKFAEIIVTKRIDDRIFTMDSKQNKTDYKNPPAGTVVYKDVVSDNFDFILVSQNVNQGTCTPTHYNVIYNTTDLSQDMFWQLTYSQCYNYYNWNGSVRVPAPVQYAHKLAYLVGQTVQGMPHEKLDQNLYYL